MGCRRCNGSLATRKGVLITWRRLGRNWGCILEWTLEEHECLAQGMKGMHVHSLLPNVNPLFSPGNVARAWGPVGGHQWTAGPHCFSTLGSPGTLAQTEGKRLGRVSKGRSSGRGPPKVRASLINCIAFLAGPMSGCLGPHISSG